MQGCSKCLRDSHLAPIERRQLSPKHRGGGFLDSCGCSDAQAWREHFVTTVELPRSNAAHLDERTYPKGIKITDAQLTAVNLTGDAFHPEWNYTINPSGN